MAFGDVQGDGSIDDSSISNNKDMEKILATIAKIINLFFDKHPKSSVFFTGSTKARTRLYRMAIGNNWAELSKIYRVDVVLQDGSIAPFAKGTACEAFIIENKY